MTRRPSIGFIQLPVPDTQSANARANVPLAAAYLKATCLEAGLAAARQVRGAENLILFAGRSG